MTRLLSGAGATLRLVSRLGKIDILPYYPINMNRGLDEIKELQDLAIAKILEIGLELHQEPHGEPCLDSEVAREAIYDYLSENKNKLAISDRYYFAQICLGLLQKLDSEIVQTGITNGNTAGLVLDSIQKNCPEEQYINSKESNFGKALLAKNYTEGVLVRLKLN